jgi:8-oxo-dGTP pyrophosphatase MutT (NUDIX family)
MSMTQVGAIPFRRVSGGLEFLIITTRSSGRWICPKGNVEAEHGRAGSAHVEAFEEAGVEGELLRPDLGTYRHGQASTPVQMWLLRVDRIHDDYPEDHERRRQWLSPADARSTVDEPGLAELMRDAITRLNAP